MSVNNYAPLMDQLEGEILHYESQLAQVQTAISSLPEGVERKNLTALESDLKELIALSKNSLADLKKDAKEDPFSEEYNLFKAELGLDSENDNTKNSEPHSSGNDAAKINKLKNDLENLKGTKCQAPFMYKWTDTVTYHNAFVSHVPEPDEINCYDNIKVKVLFTNPTHKEMLPCPYYLEGDCKFSDDKCRYSHGELVLLNSLKDYREPVFTNLSSGSKVFAKQDDGLWYRAQVLEADDVQCKVKFESNSKEESIPLHNVLPLESSEQDEDSSSDDECDGNVCVLKNDEDEIVKRILSNPPGSALGEWERFTKGFGSRMMARMGYIHGAGLGKEGTGRVEPVSAVVLPAGKSLDHCMMLKEKAGNDQDLFKAERKMKNLQRKHEEKLKRAYEREKEKTDVFTFLNSKLLSTKDQSTPKAEVKKPLKNESTRSLNVSVFQLAEEARKVEKEIKSLNQSLSRHAPNSHVFNVIKEKLTSKENQLSELHASEKKIRNEQDQRRERQKLTVF